MSNRTYDILCAISRIVLPALATFVIAFGDTWHLEYAPQIGATLTALSTLGNSILSNESRKYFEDLDNGDN